MRLLLLAVVSCLQISRAVAAYDSDLCRGEAEAAQKACTSDDVWNGLSKAETALAFKNLAKIQQTQIEIAKNGTDNAQRCLQQSRLAEATAHQATIKALACRRALEFCKKICGHEQTIYGFQSEADRLNGGSERPFSAEARADERRDSVSTCDGYTVQLAAIQSQATERREAAKTNRACAADNSTSSRSASAESSELLRVSGASGNSVQTSDKPVLYSSSIRAPSEIQQSTAGISQVSGLAPIQTKGIAKSNTVQSAAGGISKTPSSDGITSSTGPSLFQKVQSQYLRQSATLLP